jgi:hypothetical protein
MITRLFKPFLPGKWMALGFCAWLAGMMSGGIGGFSGVDPTSMASVTEDGAELWHEYGALIVIGGIAVFIVAIVLMVLFLWLSSRGKFMLLRNALDDTVAIKEPWHAYRTQAHSLFLWQLGFYAVGIATLTALTAATTLLVWPSLTGDAWSVLSMGVVTVGVIGILTVSAGFMLTQILLDDFIVPLMMKHGFRATEAWTRFLPVFKQHAGTMALYLLFRLALLFGAVMAIGIVGIFTCCCLYFLLALPYINAVVLLPVSLLFRLYSVEFLRQFGDAFDVMAEPETAEANATPDLLA